MSVTYSASCFHTEITLRIMFLRDTDIFRSSVFVCKYFMQNVDRVNQSIRHLLSVTHIKIVMIDCQDFANDTIRFHPPLLNRTGLMSFPTKKSSNLYLSDKPSIPKKVRMVPSEEQNGRDLFKW